jgi:hypothetical protein
MKIKLLCTSIMLITISAVFAEDKEQADKIAIKHCQMRYVYMGNFASKDSRVVNEKLYIERMLELKDGKLNAHYAKDLILTDVAMYERFLETKKAWRNSDLTDEEAKKFTEILKMLKSDLNVIEKNYPTDYDVFDRAESVKQEVLSEKSR